MKALVLTEIKHPLQLEERPDLEPGSQQVVIQLRAAALNRRDYWITQGMYPGISLPVILGSDGAGTVIKQDAEIAEPWISRDVIINPGWQWGTSQAAQSDQFRILGMPDDGTFATQVAAPPQYVYPKPTHLSWHESAALPLAGLTAYRALFSQGNLKSGEQVLITGIGGGVATLISIIMSVFRR